MLWKHGKNEMKGKDVIYVFRCFSFIPTFLSFSFILSSLVSSTLTSLMKRFSSIVLSLALGMQPALAFAAFSSPSELFRALILDNSARTFSFEGHGHGEGTWMSIWSSGAQQGGPDLASLKLQMKFTVDVDVPGENVKARVRAELRAVNNVMYIKVNEVSGSYEDDIFQGVLNLAFKKWIDVPFDEGMEETITALYSDPSVFAVYDELYSLESRDYQGGTSYTLKLSPEMLELFGGLPMEAPFDMTVKMDVSTSGLFQSMNMNLKGESPEGSFTFDASARKATAPLGVVAPADSVSIEELMNTLPGDPLMGLPFDPSTFIPPQDPIDCELWEEGCGEIIDDPEPVSPTGRPRTIDKRPSRRELKRIRLQQDRE